MAKINLIQAKGNSYLCDGIFSIGVYIKDQMAVLIDSGISKDVAKEINKTLIDRNVKVAAIINTHCHGDHSGGNAFFQQKYPEIKIFSSETEKPFIEDPLMAPICFCGGAAALEELKKCKPITPQQSSKVTDIITPYQDQKISICGEVFEIITLPGHTRGMIAVKTIDNVLYCGDAVFGGDTFKKYPILYYTFIEDTLSSFQKLKALVSQVDISIIYHGGIISDMATLIEDHASRILETKRIVINLLNDTPLSLEELTAKVMQKYQIADNIISLALTKTPMQAYVSELERENIIEIRVSDGIARMHILENKDVHQEHHPSQIVF